MPKTVTDVSSFTPAQKAAFNAAASLSGGSAQSTTNPAQVVNAPKITPNTPVPTAPTTPVITPTTPAVPAQIPKPVTAMSSDQGAQYASDNATKLATLKNTGLTVGADGLARYSDASFASAPSDAVQTENGTWQSGGVQYALGPATSQDPELKAMNDQITSMKTQLDSTSRAMIDNIKAQFDTLIKQQADVNMRSEASLNQSLLMGGSSRYAQESSTGQSTAMVSYGISQIADLNVREQSAIIAAQQAQDSGDMKLMDQQLSLAQKARDEKQAAAKELSAKLVAANDKIKAQKVQASRDSAVSDLLAQGITDPSQLLSLLNGNGDDFSLKEINDTLDNLNPEAKDVHQVMLNAAAKGASPAILKAIGQSRDVTSAINAAGNSLVDPSSSYGQYLSYQTKAQSLGQNPISYQDWNDANTAKADAAKAKLAASSAYNNAYNATAGKNAAEAANTGGSGSYNGDFAATIDKVANMETTVAGKKSVANSLKSFIASGDYKSAYDQIANTVEAGLVGESKQRFANARTDEVVMQGMKEAIQKYADAGGDMNILKGTTEGIYSKLGTVSDPKYKALATSLQREFQTYRNTMTGAAFTDKESAEYQAVNPTANSTLDLNLATIDGALSQLSNRVNSTIKSRAGDGAVYIKERALTPVDTQDHIIENETQATNTLQSFITSNPTRQAEINQRIDAMESQLGKPITAADFLQAFPEYAQSAEAPASNSLGMTSGASGTINKLFGSK